MPILQRGPQRTDAPPAIAAGRDDILVAAAQRDPRDFAPLFARYWDPVLRYCALRLRDRQEAEDTASQVFVAAYAGLSRFRDRGRESSFRAWLFTIAHHEVANAHRYRARHPAGSLTAAALVPDAAASPESRAVAADEITRVIAVLRELPERPRDVVALRLAGLTDREIAAVLGISGDAVRQAQSRAVTRLRERLGIVPGENEKRKTDG
ncbi:MAG: sigma-70 family RNA polymerase sigma factor [Chloroflexota bacterium]|nr:sigma-70 family RNA polymerase sigma factor [Chloroflexota bacterium]